MDGWMACNALSPSNSNYFVFAELERQRRRVSEEASVRGAMLQVVTLVNERSTDHIPTFRINSESPIVFPFEVSARTRAMEGECAKIID
jgi:hypothetical protein